MAAVFPDWSAVTRELKAPMTLLLDEEKIWLPGRFTCTLVWSPTATEFVSLLPLYVKPVGDDASAV